MELQDYIGNVQAKLGLAASTVDGGFDEGLITGWINRGVAQVITRSRINVTPTVMALTAGQYDYTLPTEIIAIDEIYSTDAASSLWVRLEHVSPPVLLNMRIGTQFQGAPPVRYYTVSGGNLLMVYPTPASADNLTIYFITRPDVLVNPTDSPDGIPEEWQQTVEYYACYQAGQYINDSASQNGERYQQMFERELKLMCKAMRQKGGRKLSPAVVGRRVGRGTFIGQPSQVDV